jgi:D-beta-D-heptose 7-phosphate kinase/D-beta-D-heptose 1-phosphate adenosyltransferase
MLKKDFVAAVDRFSGISALVVGDVMLDVYEYCLTEQSKILRSERPDRRAYVSQKAVKVLGGAGNVATNLASLGVRTSLVGITGNDENYFRLRELCDNQGISHFLVRDRHRPTTTKTRLFIDDDYLLRRDSEDTEKADKETTAALLREALHVLPQTRVVILSDYNKGMFTETLSQEIIRECRMLSIPVIVDFKPPNRSLFRGADVIAPNEYEAEEILPTFSVATLEQSTKALHGILGCRSVVVTLGEKGASGYDGAEFFHAPAHKVKARDAVGCGDTVRVGIALGQTLGMSLRESVELANFAAGVIVQKPNTSCVTAAELKAFVEERG